MPKEDIGHGAASDNNRVLFWTGNTVVDATFDHVNSMSAAELRELAKDLPKPTGPAKVPPPLPGYLPTDYLLPQTTHYALGDAATTRSGGVLPASLVDFNRGAEALTAQYQERNVDGTLTLLIYPTPQMAADRERAIETFFSAGKDDTGCLAASTGQQQHRCALSASQWTDRRGHQWSLLRRGAPPCVAGELFG